MAERGYHKCKACPKLFISENARMRRLQFAEDHINWMPHRWHHVLWSDEYTFTTSKQRKAWVIRTQGERYCPDCLQHRFYSGRASFSIWAAVGWNYKSPLVFLTGHGQRGGMSKDDYKEQVLVQHVAPFYYYHRDEGFIYMEDDNKAHGINDEDMRQWKAERGIACLEGWPPSSPDFNPIENIWRILKQRLKSYGPFTNLESLKNALQEEWTKLTQDEIRKCLVTMPWRMEEAVERRGLATRF